MPWSDTEVDHSDWKSKQSCFGSETDCQYLDPCMIMSEL